MTIHFKWIKITEKSKTQHIVRKEENGAKYSIIDSGLPTEREPYTERTRGKTFGKHNHDPELGNGQDTAETQTVKSDKRALRHPDGLYFFTFQSINYGFGRRITEESKMGSKKEWYSITELSEMGYGSRATIRQHIALGDFGAGNPGGGKWLIKKSEYDEWLQTRNKRRRRNRWQMYRHSR